MDAMRGSTRTASETTGAQKTLAIAQTVVSVVLLSAAAMLGQSLYNLEHQNLGFAVDGRYIQRSHRLGCDVCYYPVGPAIAILLTW